MVGGHQTLVSACPTLPGLSPLVGWGGVGMGSYQSLQEVRDKNQHMADHQSAIPYEQNDLGHRMHTLGPVN